jgi:hypothetical protein
LIFAWNYGLIAVPLKEAGVAKLADAPDLGSGGEILRGSSPLSGISSIVLVLELVLVLENSGVGLTEVRP